MRDQKRDIILTFQTIQHLLKFNTMTIHIIVIHFLKLVFYLFSYLHAEKMFYATPQTIRDCNANATTLIPNKL